MEPENQDTNSPNTPEPTSPPPSGSTKPAVCKICNGHGWLRRDLPVGHPEFGKVVPCPCRAREVNTQLGKVSGLTEQEQQLRLSDVKTDGREGTAAMVNACSRFLQKPAGILTLWGGVGNGKTMCLQAVVNELIEKGIPAVYVTAFDLFSHIRDAFNPHNEVVSESAYKRLMMFEMVRVLAIDEMDKVRPTDWTMEQLTDLIDKRQRRGQDGKMGTLIAMNSDPARQNEWIASRLLDGRNQVVHNPDRDMRPLMK